MPTLPRSRAAPESRSRIIGYFVATIFLSMLLTAIAIGAVV